ncbi:MAG TPA: lipoate--protein ligase [Candidatus Coprenecus stercoravium]|uniref:lipoate--protein ligase n=1 Tax=Candidatus Coprenecus stercoravium TaxID=2840735 RepID=A0A9D2K9L3_9BACT|nr:lipoate--protein ligase [Candidatus Coprenecus stercoravium]
MSSICFIDTATDPFWNLAAEEYLLTKVDRPVFRLWRNAPSVIVGRYQNALAEINSDYVRTHGIPVVRRLTGGGAVFHDLGNVNYTFIDRKVPGEDTAAMFRRFTAPVIDALRGLGVDASLQGRNDLVIDGRKFSGNAVCVHGDRVLQHGTLLFSASVADLSGALNTRPEKFIGKSVQSNRSRVTNISDHLPIPMLVTEFISYMQARMAGSTGTEVRSYTTEEKAEIDSLRQSKYSTWQWNFGSSPRYGLNQIRKFQSGLIEISADVCGGIIRTCSIRGDYFFTRPTEEVEQALAGVPHTHTAVLSALSALPLSDYFGPISADELTSLFF